MVRDDRAILSTLAHEMAHLWQHYFGKPSRTGYHNKEWADRMEKIGLMPSETGRPGGKRTGQRVSQYVIAGGRFHSIANELLQNFHIQWASSEVMRVRPARSRYTCPICNLKVWGKPRLSIICEKCEHRLLEKPVP